MYHIGLCHSILSSAHTDSFNDYERFLILPFIFSNIGSKYKCFCYEI